MKHTVNLILEQRPEVLERVLRVVRHRGFKVTKMNMQLANDKTAGLDITVESERGIELLTKQLDKLIDVIECSALVHHTSERLVS
ncbi:acetolactate synthase 2 small subunit [Shewanella sp. D64]|uniref:acetolactate synthase 2 small subunit n=1 Tax=unclassified Shewanella TaxID=196818 RepID=UPI0022BA5E2A|nr:MULTISPECIES: acetolactate synthase 2 small subunit [unclassified Shewanella]MEC4727385.1 acetolactate synthase 2 small subunit [Shewanella sp. D64]MEC4739540.1 acetolactate synthase 2 small subunit [Shewanella sp. E94]WBJ96076.1 acetolactate synthase 2 small subunit [Shewanella sp. MTB7]